MIVYIVRDGEARTHPSKNTYEVNPRINVLGDEVEASVIAGGGTSSFPHKIGVNGAIPATVGSHADWTADSGYNPETNAVYVATIGGGYDNITNQVASTIAGGAHNFIKAGSGNFNHSTIGGGSINLISASYSTIAGGTQNSIGDGAGWGTISGGQNNSVQGDIFNVVAGGSTNAITGQYCVISGGRFSDILASSTYCFVGGGYNQAISGCDFSLIVGGDDNQISVSDNSSILGGADNTISGGSYSICLGGNTNALTGATYSVCLGGQTNSATANYSAVGGQSNAVTNTHSLVWGQENSCAVKHSAIFGQDAKPFANNSIMVSSAKITDAGDCQASLNIGGGETLSNAFTSIANIGIGSDVFVGHLRLSVLAALDGSPDKNNDADYSFAIWEDSIGVHFDGTNIYMFNGSSETGPGTDQSLTLTKKTGNTNNDYSPGSVVLRYSSGLLRVYVQGTLNTAVKWSIRYDWNTTRVE